ncbi:NUDIX domain-containing protein [Pseudonocardia acaciae]|uniref:NUDIX domain-containing protein n=1 Tax=Pseudonocardia acaciae TaxID=551276 RepID=UPI0004916565|nr:NUDIX domain-containing protein [Pseudonocardia acaciae]
MKFDGPGDGWAWCELGHRHWGLYGAAGLLLRHRSADGEDWVLMQHRSWWSHHGDTWGLLGGARTPGESAEQAAAREAWEEAGLAAAEYAVTGSYLDDHRGWSYTTVLAHAEKLVSVTARTEESAEVRWVRQDDLPTLPLHPGFADTWPAVAALL